MQQFSEKSHILIIDDDDRIRDLLRRYLVKHDYIVNCAEDSQDAKSLMTALSYDLLIVDVMMPGQDGFSLTEEIRQSSDIPIILLTARGEGEDRISGLSSGADDYVTKPFEPKELLLRIEAILRRAQKFSAKRQARVKIGDWLYDRDKLQLQKDGATVVLTQGENKLLDLLASNGNNPVSREELVQHMELGGNDRTIDVQITRLRKKLDDTQKPPQILTTVRGKGYMLRVDQVV